MKTWIKILIVIGCTGMSGGLSYASSIWPDGALAFAGFAAGFTGIMGWVVGWPPKTGE